MENFPLSILPEHNYSSEESQRYNHKERILPVNAQITQFECGLYTKENNLLNKSDFATFTNCIQQSTLLDHRLDSGSLNNLCELKYPNSSPLNSPVHTINTDSNLKNLLFIDAIESSNLLHKSTDLSSHILNEINANTKEESFTNISFAKDDAGDSKNSVNYTIDQTQSQVQYVTLKSCKSDKSYNEIANSEILSGTTNTKFESNRNDYRYITKCLKSNPTSKCANNKSNTQRTSKLKNKCSSYICNASLSALNESTTNFSISKCKNKNNEVPEQNNIINKILDNSESDSLSSSTELIDFEVNDGYQDNTSSHSQQSTNGGGGSNGGGGGSSNSISNNNIGLLNGTSTNQNSSTGYMSLLPPVVSGPSNASGHLNVVNGSGTSATSGTTGEVIDFKHLFEELCPVCGDKVSGYHYGLLTCESCKGFFKRTVQNKKVYTCVAERSCHIDKTQRKRCPYCRFQKCLEVGMKLEAVRADRMRGGRNKFGPMYKRDRARKLQVMRQRQLALQALRTSIGSADMKVTPLSPGYQQAYPNMNIKQEIQIPQISSLTQSPDSSPSPIAIALGQVNASTSVISTPINSNSGVGGNGSNNNNNNNNNSTNTTSDSLNRSGGGPSDEGTGSLQNNTVESKLCFDSGTHPSSTADSINEPLRVSPMIRDFVQSIDDREWQTQLFALLQKQTYNQVEVDLFELMCKVLDQNLFSQVDWARNTVFFKDLKVDDQMKLLQHSWSDMLVLDHLHQRIHNGLPDETQLNNGQMFNLLWLGLLGVPQLADYFNELQNKLQDLKFDMGDYVCMKFLILLNPDVRGIINKKTVLEGHENVQAALLDYTLTCYPSVTDKFRRLLNILPDIHAMATRGEDHLYSKHCAGSAPTQTLLMEMLHAKRKV